MSKAVLDSSVLIAIFKDEMLGIEVRQVIEGAMLSAVNYVEVLSKLSDLGIAEGPWVTTVFGLLARIAPFTPEQARTAAGLRDRTRTAGLSLGDRACLALALELGAEVYTADRQWAHVEAGCTIHLIR